MHDDLTEGEYEAAQDEGRVEDDREPTAEETEADNEWRDVPEVAPFALETDDTYKTVVVNASFNEFRKGDRLTVDARDEKWAGYISSGMASVVD